MSVPTVLALLRRSACAASSCGRLVRTAVSSSDPEPGVRAARGVSRRSFLGRSLLGAATAAVAAAAMSLAGCTKPKEEQTPSTGVAPKTGPATKGTAAAPESGDGAKPELEVGTTLENLQAAFNGESNAHARYLGFAKKADEEGYKQAARLFRAAARSEEIHTDNHKTVIEGLGGAAEAEIRPADVKSTADNLKAAYDGESYEQGTMYPEYLKVAQKDKDKEAIKTLNRALKSEVEHAKYYQQAMDDLENWKAVSADFYVCPECGFTTDKLDFEDCPVCDEPANEFETIA